MSKLRVHAFSISLDGYGAGPAQILNEPLGVGGEAMHEWIVGTRTFKQLIGQQGDTQGPDDEQYLEAGLVDEMHLAVTRVLLGAGEHLLGGLDLPALGYECSEYVPTANAAHFVLSKRAAAAAERR